MTRSATLDAPVASTLTLREVAEELVEQALDDHPGERAVTLLAVSVSNLAVAAPAQLELPVLEDDPRRGGSPTGAARLALDRSVDAVRERFGRGSVGYATPALSERTAVPDEFRELAERDV